MLLAGCTATPTSPATDLAVGLVAHYPFDGDAQDHSGNDYHGIVQGATLAKDRADRPQSAYKFDGKNDYIIVSPLLDVETDFSIAVFLKPNDYGIKSLTSSFCARTILSHRFRAHKNQDPLNSGLIFRLVEGRGCDGNTFFAGRFIDPDFQYNPILYQYTEEQPDGWFHYTLTRASDMMILYLDGQEVSRVKVSAKPVRFNPKQTATTIGATLHQDGRLFFPFDGVLDDLRIYDRALEADEVQQLYGGQSVEKSP